jgi:hypothetical protein
MLCVLPQECGMCAGLVDRPHHHLITPHHVAPHHTTHKTTGPIARDNSGIEHQYALQDKVQNQLTSWHALHTMLYPWCCTYATTPAAGITPDD